MRRIAWLTDIHLNFLEGEQCVEFLDGVSASSADAVVLSGDIAESHTLAVYLRSIARHIAVPVYFVLGNHDFYYGGIAKTRAAVRQVCRDHSNLHWLTDRRIITLAPGTALVGHDGWADGRNGDFFGSDVLMTDFFIIDDLAGHSKQDLLDILQQLGDESAAYVTDILPQALASHDHIILATHVPPYKEAALYDGRISSDNFLPHMSNRAMGEALSAIMSRHPTKNLLVLCGHTHGAGTVRIAPNILVRAGGAEYGAPCIQDFIDI